MDERTYIHPAAVIIGDVTIGKSSSVWPGAVMRGDFNSITIGDVSSVQDNVVIHATPTNPTVVGNYVTVGHAAVLHGCTVGDYVIVGMNSTILDGAKIGNNCIVAGGCVVPPGTVVPDGSLVMGVPARIKEGKADKKAILQSAQVYYELSRRHLDGIDRFVLADVIEAMKNYR
jgi:carbonic anhydrase/acetyltransferase-like protein (isoleucine patch superfamily)